MMGAGRKAMRGAWVALGLLLCVAGSVFGGGSQESKLWFRAVDPSHNNAAVEQIGFQFTQQFGTSRVTYNVNRAEANPVGYALVQDGDAYYNPATNADVVGGAAAMALASAGYGTYSVLTNLTGQFDLTEYGQGTLSVGRLPESMRLGNVAAVSISWSKFVEQHDITFLIVRSNGAYSKLHVVFVPEFFKGEKALFDDPIANGLSYQQKALAFMDTLFVEGSSEDGTFRALVHDSLDSSLAPDAAFWATFRVASGNNALIGGQRFNLYREDFRTAMSINFAPLLENRSYDGDPGHTVDLPYFQTNQSSFAAIYGKYRNLYVTSYLLYLVKQQKPVYSAIMQQKLAPLGFPYDYAQYRLLSKDEGLAVAQSALRYLTWGVEYTPDTGANTVSVGKANQEVFNAFRQGVTDWVSSDSPSGSRDKNYLPSTLMVQAANWKGGETPPAATARTHVLEGDYTSNVLQVVGTSAKAEGLGVSRIDLFTATNLAWQAGVIKDGVAGVPANDTAAVPTVDGGRADSRMSDRKLYLQNPTASIHLVRGSAEQKLAVGYEFNGVQTVGGIALINGDGVQTSLIDVHAGGSYLAVRNQFKAATAAGNPMLKLQYQASDRKWYDWPGGFREIVYDYQGSQIGWRDFVDYEPTHGWSLANGERYSHRRKPDGNLEKELSYVYLIPRVSRSDIWGVRILDSTATPTLQIAEMMVFDKDPIGDITGLARRANQGASPDYYESFPQRGSPEVGMDFSVGTGWDEPEATGGRGKGYLLFNGALSHFYGLKAFTDGVWRISIPLGGTVPIRTVVVWERDDPAKSASDMQYEPIALTFESDLLKPLGMSLSAAGLVSLALGNRLTTPFSSPSVSTIWGAVGNPLPYASQGIDSPRTFAYKMERQRAAREWFAQGNPLVASRFFTDYPSLTAKTALRQERYSDGYVSELDVLRKLDPESAVRLRGNYRYSAVVADQQFRNLPAGIKAFLPGKLINTEAGYISDTNSPYEADKIAGVDALGMVAGALSMAGLDGVLTALNVSVPRALDGYYQMRAGSAARGLDADGKPAFRPAVASGGVLSRDYHLKRSDLERSTVLIPDVSLLQAGDLLVKYDAAGAVQVGVVVGFPDTLPPTYGTDTKDFWQKVIVVTARRGFQMVSMGTWGNPAGGFGGFAADPEDFQIRRFVTRKDPNAALVNHAPPVDAWECVKVVPTKAYTDYPMAYRGPETAGGLVPWGPETVDVIDQIGNTSFLKELPPTSYRFDYVAGRLFDQNPDHKLWFNSLTGWRDLTARALGIGYHRGMDAIYYYGATYQRDILAPERGVFYFVDTSVREAQGFTIPLPESCGTTQLGIDSPVAPRNWESIAIGIVRTVRSQC